MNEEKYLAEKDQYFLEAKSNKQLSDAFQKKLKDNSLLSEEFELENKIRAAYTLEYKEKLKEMAQEVRQNSSPSNKVVSSQFRWVIIAASMILLVGAWFFVNHEAFDPEGQYVASINEHQKTTLAKNSLRSPNGGSGFSDSLGLGIQFFLKGNYKESNEIIDELLIKHPDNEEVVLQKSFNSYFEEDYAKCEGLLAKLSKSSIKDTREEADMLSVQVLVKRNKSAQAKSLLSLISNQPKHKYASYAKEYLKII